MAFKTLFNQIGCGFSNIVTLRKKKEISFESNSLKNIFFWSVVFQQWEGFPRVWNVQNMFLSLRDWLSKLIQIKYNNKLVQNPK